MCTHACSDWVAFHASASVTPVEISIPIPHCVQFRNSTALTRKYVLRFFRIIESDQCRQAKLLWSRVFCFSYRLRKTRHKNHHKRSKRPFMCRNVQEPPDEYCNTSYYRDSFLNYLYIPQNGNLRSTFFVYLSSRRSTTTMCACTIPACTL